MMLVWSFSSNGLQLCDTPGPGGAGSSPGWVRSQTSAGEGGHTSSWLCLGGMGLNPLLKKPTIHQMYWCDLNIPVPMETELKLTAVLLSQRWSQRVKPESVGSFAAFSCFGVHGRLGTVAAHITPEKLLVINRKYQQTRRMAACACVRGAWSSCPTWNQTVCLLHCLSVWAIFIRMDKKKKGWRGRLSLLLKEMQINKLLWKCPPFCVPVDKSLGQIRVVAVFQWLKRTGCWTAAEYG